MMTPDSTSTGKQRRQGRRKHIPVRTCVSCREKEAKRTFTRIVRTPEMAVEIDPTGKKNGRGAYLCTRKSCWERAADSNILDRALNVTVNEDTRAELRKYADYHFRDGA